MNEKKGFPFTLSIIAFIIGVELSRQIDFKNFKVEKPGLSVVYFFTFIFCVIAIIRQVRRK